MKKIVLMIIIAATIFCAAGCGKKDAEFVPVYTINAEYFDSGVITAHMTVDYRCGVREGLTALKFNLPPNAFRERAKITPMEEGAKSFGGMEIIAVRGDAPLDYDVCGADENVLEVFLPSKLGYGQQTRVNIDFAVMLADGSYRLSRGENTVNIGNWYPVLAVRDGDFVECEYGRIGDPFYSTAADYNVKLVVPSSFVVAASGSAVSCDVEGDKTQYAYSLRRARDFAFCLSDKFEVISNKWGNRTVNYYYFNDDNPQSTYAAIVEGLKFFSEKFCEYPYSSYSVAESDFNAGGMEYAGLVFINAELSEENKVYTAVHETAHQWWYGLVGNNQLEEAYLDEGLTEYSAAVFFDENEEYGVDADEIFLSAENACDGYSEIMSALGLEPNAKMIRRLSEFSGEYEYVVITYNRGLTMMRAAEKAVGRKRIMELLSEYAEKFKYKIADTDDFLSAMRPAARILRSYINGSAS